MWQVAGLVTSCDTFDLQHNEEGVKVGVPHDASIKMFLYSYIYRRVPMTIVQHAAHRLFDE